MKIATFANAEAARAEIGAEVGITDWLEIDQQRINAFADATGDHQWIHIDVERAKRESPFGAPIAHGYLTLSLLAHFAQSCIKTADVKLAVNYGLNRVRFMAPVRVGSRVRARFTLADVEDVNNNGVQVTWKATIDIEGQEKPACMAEMLTRWYF